MSKNLVAPNSRNKNSEVKIKTKPGHKTMLETIDPTEKSNTALGMFPKNEVSQSENENEDSRQDLISKNRDGSNDEDNLVFDSEEEELRIK